MKQFAIFIWGIRDWEAPTIGRSRYLAEGLAAVARDSADVFFVSPPLQHKFPLRHTEFWRAWKLAKQMPTFQHSGVMVLRPRPCPLPYAHHFTPFRVGRAIFIGRQLRQFINSHHKFPVLVLYDPKEWLLAKWWRKKGGVSVYDCVDLMPAFRGAGERIAREENQMVNFVSLITCSARGLVEHIHTLSPQVPVALVRNGVHWQRFQMPQPVHPSIAAVPRPRIGFIGSISYWVNLELIVEVAKRCPDWHFVFVGPQKRPVALLPNLHFPLPVTPEEAVSCIWGFDVGLIPFHDTPLVRCVNPLKLYEYLACGKPVVATPYCDFGEVEGLVYFAETVEGFIEAIQRALGEDTPELQERRRQISAQADWINRAQQFLEALKGVA